MNIKRWAYGFLGLAAPWIVLLAGAAAEVYNAWLYVGCITWFGTAVIVLLGLSK
ncbi:MAG: hypothetical protein PHU95_01605 [Candidatus Thermoplasmatota archaeon]|nr:hypothetical protein [Candidatus Thermoplasmatota archaeon]MDD5778130.1 hypothetical protein [Candidatus Thermoplasmatota archaeon]